MRTVPRAKRPDATLFYAMIPMIVFLSVASGRFARGTVMLTYNFLCKAFPHGAMS